MEAILASLSKHKIEVLEVHITKYPGEEDNEITLDNDVSLQVCSMTNKAVAVVCRLPSGMLQHYNVNSMARAISIIKNQLNMG